MNISEGNFANILMTFSIYDTSFPKISISLPFVPISLQNSLSYLLNEINFIFSSESTSDNNTFTLQSANIISDNALIHIMRIYLT